MKLAVFSAAALLFLAACGHPPAGEAYLFAQRFDVLARAHRRYVPTMEFTIDFPELPGGAKERIDCAGRHLSIAASVWADIRDGYREAAVFHVLAHCLIGRGHRAGNTTSGHAISQPWSLMNPDLVPGLFYSSDVDRYREELFVSPFRNDTVYP